MLSCSALLSLVLASTATDGGSTATAAQLISVDGLRIQVVEAGPRDAPPIVLLHGFMVSTETFAALQSRLAERYRVISYDAPGHGQSSRPHRRLDGDYNARVLLRLLDALQIERAVLVGQSMGAQTALHLAARWPGRAAAVVAVNPAGFDPGFWRRMGMKLFVQPSVYRSGPDQAFWLTALGSTYVLGEPALADYRRQLVWRREPGWARSMASVYAELRRGALGPVAEQVRVPVTLVFGLEDGAYGEDYRQRVIAHLPRAQVVRIESCGHNVHHDAPGRLIEAIEAVAASAF